MDHADTVAINFLFSLTWNFFQVLVVVVGNSAAGKDPFDEEQTCNCHDEDQCSKVGVDLFISKCGREEMSNSIPKHSSTADRIEHIFQNSEGIDADASA